VVALSQPSRPLLRLHKIDRWLVLLPAPAPSPSRPTAKGVARCPTSGRGAAIPSLLIIDDDPTLLTTFEHIFGEEYTVRTASTAAEGLELLAQQ